jgi:hypothetical protein
MFNQTSGFRMDSSPMRTFAIPATAEKEKRAEHELKDFVTHWVSLLADHKYAEALDLLSPEIPRGSGSVDSHQAPRWTPHLLEAVIANYGTPTAVEGQPQSYAVVPLDASLRDAFDTNVSIDFDREAISNLNAESILPPEREPQMGLLSKTLSFLGKSRGVAKTRKPWLGGAEFALPLNFERGNDISDLSVRMQFKPVSQSEMVLVLLDIHVL